MNQQIQKLRQDLIDRLIQKMDEGHDWIRPWLSHRPTNAVSNRPYHGVNILLLMMAAEEKGYNDPRWCTYYAAQQKGWQVRRGERATAIEFWQLVETEVENEETGEKETQMIWKGKIHHVFNAQQIDGIPSLEETQNYDADYDVLANNLIESSACPVREDAEPRAYYRPSEDYIHLPSRETFTSSASFVSTLLHEMGHSTGHPKRLGRDMIVKMANGEPLTEYVQALQGSGLYRYYCQNRLEPGALPRKAEAEIETMNPFDDRQMIQTDHAESALRAWGYIETKEPIDSALLKKYDLIAAKGSYRTVKLDQNEIDNYPAEELVAEFASAMMESELNVTEHHADEQHAAYLQSWGKDIKQDPNKLFNAIKAADKAADYVLDSYKKLMAKKEEEQKEKEPEEPEKQEEKQEEKEEQKKLDLLNGPVVTITFSEHSDLAKKEGEAMTLKEASKLFKTLDEAEIKAEGYYKTGFRIDYLMGEASVYTGRYDIGSEGVSLLEHIKSYYKGYFDEPLYRAKVIKEIGEENADRYIEDQKKSFEKMCKFFTYHYNLESIQEEAKNGLQTIQDLINNGRSAEEFEDRTKYYEALLAFVKESKDALAKDEDLPVQPKKEDYIQEKKDPAEKLANKLQEFFENAMHQKTDAQTYTDLLKEHDVDTIIVTLQKAERFAKGDQKETISSLIDEVRQHIKVDLEYIRPNETIREFASNLSVTLPDEDRMNEIYDSLLNSGDNMNPADINDLDGMRSAKDLWAANVKSGHIKWTKVIAQGSIVEKGENLEEAIDIHRQLANYRYAKDIQIGRDFGVFDPEKMLDSYEEREADRNTLERELLFERLKKDTPAEAMNEIYKTSSVEPYMIPHLHVVVQKKEMSFERFNKLCDLNEPSKVYVEEDADKKKSNKGLWLKKVRETAAEGENEDEKKAR